MLNFTVIVCAYKSSVYSVNCKAINSNRAMEIARSLSSDKDSEIVDCYLVERSYTISCLS